MGRPEAQDWQALAAQGREGRAQPHGVAARGRPEGGRPRGAPRPDRRLLPRRRRRTSRAASSWIEQQVRSARPVVVHCGAGLGRTGTVVAAFLAAQGMPPEEAIREVRRLRPGSLETPRAGGGRPPLRRGRGARGPRRGEPQAPRRLLRRRGAHGARAAARAPGRGGHRASSPRSRRATTSRDAIRRAKADVVVDFTEPASAAANARAILRGGAQGVIGTTGFTAADLDALDAEARAAGRGLLVAPNFAIGVAPRSSASPRRRRATSRAPRSSRRTTRGRRTRRRAPRCAPPSVLARAGAKGGPRERARGAARGLDVGGVRVHSLRLPGVLARQEVHFGGRGRDARAPPRRALARVLPAGRRSRRAVDPREDRLSSAGSRAAARGRGRP